MAAEVETMFPTRVKPWHGIGTVVEECPNAKEAIKLAGLDWKVEQKDIFTESGIAVSGYKANVRDSDQAMTDFGRPEITLHKLRHTCCLLLINKGWDLKKLQYWLGHSDASTTLNIYSHFNRKRLNESENDLNSISAAASDLFMEAC